MNEIPPDTRSETAEAVRNLLLVLTLLLVFAMAARYAATPDTWWHLRAGEWIWQHKALPGVDHFSFTRAGAPWHYPGWPMEVLFYLLFTLGGLGALNIFQAVVVTTVFGLVWATGRGNPLLKAALVSLGAMTAAVHWSARPYLITLLFSALYLWILTRWQAKGGKAIWWLPVLMVLWVNGHGGFTLGFVWWGVFFVGAVARWLWSAFQKESEQARKLRRRAATLGWVGMFTLAASLLNPYGAEMLTYTSKTLHMEATKLFIAEWQSPDFHSVQLWPLMGMLLLMVLGFGLSPTRLTVEESLLALGLTYMVLTWVRNVDVFAVAVTPILIKHWEEIRRTLADRWPWKRKKPPAPVRPAVNLGIVALAALVAFGKGGVASLPKVTAAATARNYPTRAVEFIKQHHPQGNMFNEYGWGGFLTWDLREYPVFIDGRADLYGDKFIKKWLATRNADNGWEATLDYWDIHFVLLKPDAPLVRILPYHGWRLLYRDSQSVIYGR